MLCTFKTEHEDYGHPKVYIFRSVILGSGRAVPHPPRTPAPTWLSPQPPPAAVGP